MSNSEKNFSAEGPHKVDKFTKTSNLNDVKSHDNSKEVNNEAVLNFTVHLFKRFKIDIYKPLVTLKLMLFIYYGAASFVAVFLTVYFKQRGVTLTELSIALILTPFIQAVGTIITGVAADKFGRLKPILVINIILTILLLGGLLVIPKFSGSYCNSVPINLKCDPPQLDRINTENTCNVVGDVIKVKTCNVQCKDNINDRCDGHKLICEIVGGEQTTRNFSLTIEVGEYLETKSDSCIFNIISLSHENLTFTWCDIPSKKNCSVSCPVESGIQCKDDRLLLLILTMTLYVLFMTVYSNCYRFLDITSMALVSRCGKDYGKQRLFGTLGTIIISPLAGLLVDSTTHSDNDKNYNSAFYLFMAAQALLLAIVCKHDFPTHKPAKKMGKKIVELLKNADVMGFAFVVFVLGSTWSYVKNFLYWYLEEMEADNLLIGLIPAVGSLYGIPFLANSNWWVIKIGPDYIFISAFLAYAVNCIGYSFLQNAWYSLLLEATSIITSHLLWVAVVVHSNNIAPEGLTATVIGTAGSIHYHFGKASGSAIGGFVMSSFGGRVAFRVMAAICVVSAALYGLFLYIRRSCWIKTTDSRISSQIGSENENKLNQEALEITKM